MPQAHLLEVGASAANNALRGRESAPGLLLLAASQLKGCLQWEVILAHAASPCSAASLLLGSLNLRRKRSFL
jgi:hypothetical protein